MASALALRVDDLESFRVASPPELEAPPHQDDPYWERAFASLVARVKVTVRAARAGRADPHAVTRDHDILLRRLVAREIKFLSELLEIERQIQQAPALDESFRRNIELDARRSLASLQGGRKELVNMRQREEVFTSPYPIRTLEDGIEFDPVLMEESQPYAFELGGETHVAVRTGEEVNFYALPQPFAREA